MAPNMERPAPAVAPAPTTASRWLRARATSALANAGAAARTAAAAATTAATTVARAALPTVGPSSPILVPVVTSTSIDGDEDEWHLVTEEDVARPSLSAPAPSGPPETEEELSRRWHAMKPHLDTAIRAGNVEAERTWRAAMSKVNARMERLQKARVESLRREEAEKVAEAARERRDAAKAGWTKKLLRGMGTRAFKKPSEGKQEEGKPPENSFYRGDEEDEDEESEEACDFKDEGGDDDDDDDDPAAWEDALDAQQS